MYLVSALSTLIGMVPALYSDEEKDGLIASVRQEALNSGCSPAKDELWQYFVKKCSRGLHIVLCMSPVGDTLRTRCRNFLGLVNNTSIGENSSLHYVSIFYFYSFNLENCNQRCKNSILLSQIKTCSISVCIL